MKTQPKRRNLSKDEETFLFYLANGQIKVNLYFLLPTQRNSLTELVSKPYFLEQVKITDVQTALIKNTMASSDNLGLISNLPVRIRKIYDGQYKVSV